MASRQLLAFLDERYERIADKDLEEFFNNVPRDRPMSLERNIKDEGNTKSLICKYLKAGTSTKRRKGNIAGRGSVAVAAKHYAERAGQGTGGERSAIHRMCRRPYVAISSEAGAKHVMWNEVTDRIQWKLGRRENMSKTHIARPTGLKYLVCCFYRDRKAKEWECRPQEEDSATKQKRKQKELTCGKMPGKDIGIILRINQVTGRWINHYALGSMKTAMKNLTHI